MFGGAGGCWFVCGFFVWFFKEREILLIQENMGDPTFLIHNSQTSPDTGKGLIRTLWSELTRKYKGMIWLLSLSIVTGSQKLNIF